MDRPSESSGGDGGGGCGGGSSSGSSSNDRGDICILCENIQRASCVLGGREPCIGANGLIKECKFRPKLKKQVVLGCHP